MRRSLGIVLGAVWFGAAMILVFTVDSRAVSSAAWVTDAVVSLSAVLWPILLGLCAADSVRLLRSDGASDMVRSLPTPLSWRMLVLRSLTTAFWAVIGMLAALVAAFAFTAMHGSIPAASLFPQIVIAALGSLGFAILGQALGAFVPSWFLPPLAAVALYLAYGFNLGGTGALFRFVSAGDELSSAFALRSDIFAIYAAMFLLLTTVALVLVRVALERLGIVSSVLSGLALVVLVAGSTAVLTVEDHGVFTYVSEHERVCTGIKGSTARVCLPREQRSQLDRSEEILAPFAARVEALGPDSRDAVYSPFTDGTKQQIFFNPLVGDEVPDREDITMSIVLSLVDCEEALPINAETDVALSVVSTWIMPEFSGEGMLMRSADFSAGPPSRSQAHDALRELRSCAGAQ